MNGFVSKQGGLRLVITGLLALLQAACGGGGSSPPPSSAPPPSDDSGTPPPAGFSLDAVVDVYSSVVTTPEAWGFYNVHDPSVMQAADGKWYAYSTDASWGNYHEPGIQVRRSEDLVEWTYLGTAIDGLPPMAVEHIHDHGGEPFDGVWAPYGMRVGDEYRLYYSLSSPTPRLSVIGLLVASSAEGPWTERGLVVTSDDDASIQTNAIDPSVVVTPEGEHWFYYGSAWDGIYLLQLDPATGLALTPGDKGVRIAQRGATGGVANGNIEGAEIIYNPDFGQYYLFIAYDWLETKYNVRVGRADHPQGPFRDYQGNDLNLTMDDGPMILAPYQFSGHAGWQGTAHNAAFRDPSSGQWYIAHQGRPSADPVYMVQHLRELFWTPDGWPMVSPERYAGVAQDPVDADELVGDWDQIVLGYRVVPGYAETQTDPDLQVAVALHIDAAGTLNGDAATRWDYEAPWLSLRWANGYTDRVHVSRARDWERKIESTLVFTGFNDDGTAIWGKQLSP